MACLALSNDASGCYIALTYLPHTIAAISDSLTDDTKLPQVRCHCNTLGISISLTSAYSSCIRCSTAYRCVGS